MQNDLFFLKELADRGLRKKFGQYLPRLEINRVQKTNTRPSRSAFTAFATMYREKHCGWFIFCDNVLHENPPIRTETKHAYTEDEHREIIAALPYTAFSRFD